MGGIRDSLLEERLSGRLPASQKSLALGRVGSYSLDAEEHLRALTARRRKIVLDTVDNQSDGPSYG